MPTGLGNGNGDSATGREELDILWKRYHGRCSTSVAKTYFEEHGTGGSRNEVYLSQVLAQMHLVPPDVPTDLQLLTETSSDDAGQPLGGSSYGKTSSISPVVRRFIKLKLWPAPCSCARAFCSPECVAVTQQTSSSALAVGEVIVGLSSGARANIVQMSSNFIFFQALPPLVPFQTGEQVRGNQSGGVGVVTQDAHRCPLSRPLRHVIPFDYGNGGYGYALFREDGSRIEMARYRWHLDTSAGVITFYGDLPPGFGDQTTLRLTTYCYVGKVGLNTSNDSMGRVGIGTEKPAVSLDIRAQDAMCMPAGATSSRPMQPRSGYLRFNTDFDSVEAYTGCEWQDLTNGTGFGSAAVNLGTGGLDRQIAIGNATGDTGVSITSGTGNIGLRSNAGISLDANSDVNIQTRGQGGSSIVIGGNNSNLSLDLVASGSNSSINFVGPVNFSQANNITIQPNGGLYFDSLGGDPLWRLMEVVSNYDTNTASLAVQKFDTISGTWLTRFRFD